MLSWRCEKDTVWEHGGRASRIIAFEGGPARLVGPASGL
jgi:hypothetical protein